MWQYRISVPGALSLPGLQELAVARVRLKAAPGDDARHGMDVALAHAHARRRPCVRYILSSWDLHEFHHILSVLEAPVAT